MARWCLITGQSPATYASLNIGERTAFITEYKALNPR